MMALAPPPDMDPNIQGAVKERLGGPLTLKEYRARLTTSGRTHGKDSSGDIGVYTPRPRVSQDPTIP